MVHFYHTKLTSSDFPLWKNVSTFCHHTKLMWSYSSAEDCLHVPLSSHTTDVILFFCGRLFLCKLLSHTNKLLNLVEDSKSQWTTVNITRAIYLLLFRRGKQWVTYLVRDSKCQRQHNTHNLLDLVPWWKTYLVRQSNSHHSIVNTTQHNTTQHAWLTKVTWSRSLVDSQGSHKLPVMEKKDLTRTL